MPIMETEQEAALVRRLQARDQVALAELYDQFGTSVYHLTRRLVKDVATAENLTQETFLYIWNRIGGFDPARGSLACWIGLVARSRALDYVRSVQGRAARSTVPLEHAYPCSHPVPVRAGLTQVERAHLLQGPWMRLRRSERRALGLAYYLGMSHGEIAERLNRPLGTIKTWIRQGLQSLRADLEGAHEV